MKITFNNQTFIMKLTDIISIDDLVYINQIFGWIDFIGEELIIILDNNGKKHCINCIDLNTVFQLNEYTEEVINTTKPVNLCNINWLEEKRKKQLF